MNVCVIPARGGSKRIPYKNIRAFCGKPIIAWSILVAQKSKLFDRIIVSTDDDEISKVAISYGAEVPFFRPPELSNDVVGTTPVIVHAAKELQLVASDNLCCLYATAPFTSSSDLQEAMQLLTDSVAGTVVFGATSFAFPIQRAIRIDQYGYSSPVDPLSICKRSQDLEELFHDAGQFYLAPVDVWTSNFQIFDVGRPLILPRWRVQEIDTEEDWRCAELLHKILES